MAESEQFEVEVFSCSLKGNDQRNFLEAFEGIFLSTITDLELRRRAMTLRRISQRHLRSEPGFQDTVQSRRHRS